MVQEVALEKELKWTALKNLNWLWDMEARARWGNCPVVKMERLSISDGNSPTGPLTNIAHLGEGGRAAHRFRQTLEHHIHVFSAARPEAVSKPCNAQLSA
eukprot:1150771-Pelagomonas_calceolata.AAC.3